MFINSVRKPGRHLVLSCFIALSIFILPMLSHGASSNEEVTLRMANYIPIGYDPYIYPSAKLFVDMINNRGKGIVQIDAYWGGTLLKAKQLLPGLQAGTADMIFIPGAYLLGSFPILGVESLPLWKTINASYEVNMIGTPLAKLKNDQLKKKNVMQLVTSGVLPEFLWTRNKLVRSPSDLKGLKIRTSGKVASKLIQILGAVPVSMPSAELPMALQRGVVDGATMNPWTAQGRGVEEYCKYMLIYPLAGITNPVYVQYEKWNKLPEKVRKVLTDVAVDWQGKAIGPANAIINDNQMKTELLPYYEKKGVKTIFLNKEEEKAFDTALTPLIKWWVKSVGTQLGNKALDYAQGK